MMRPTIPAMTTVTSNAPHHGMSGNHSGQSSPRLGEVSTAVVYPPTAKNAT